MTGHDDPDCGCGGNSLDMNYALELGDVGEPPSLQEMEAALSEVAGDTGVELAAAELEAALTADEELPFTFDDADMPTLSNVLALAERYPGLKITFSF